MVYNAGFFYCYSFKTFFWWHGSYLWRHCRDREHPKEWITEDWEGEFIRWSGVDPWKHP